MTPIRDLRKSSTPLMFRLCLGIYQEIIQKYYQKSVKKLLEYLIDGPARSLVNRKEIRVNS